MDVACNLIRLKQGSLPTARKWAETMNDRMKEVLASLHDESVVIESVFLLSRREGDYLVYYMRAVSMEQSRTSVKTSEHEVDAIHKRFKQEVWESIEETELLLDASIWHKTEDSALP
ncbi:hypothetical protein KT71_15419 [Congregibacter litoralis KT71]|uniref:Uncharacterized protein n=2 Tax=Congregibacter TaxID=393661 RepID=A4A8H2_9GAMM|nr:DUF6176 family protein [Congregibacter litoralis]EAQ97967.2 hypothetical protein KT71_15419 [Congregibacter litoralis KT71]